MSSTTPDSDSGFDAGRTNVQDPDELREELIRLVEDVDAGDLATAEDRTTSLLSDIRRARQHGGDA